MAGLFDDLVSGSDSGLFDDIQAAPPPVPNAITSDSGAPAPGAPAIPATDTAPEPLLTAIAKGTGEGADLEQPLGDFPETKAFFQKMGLVPTSQNLNLFNATTGLMTQLGFDAVDAGGRVFEAVVHGGAAAASDLIEGFGVPKDRAKQIGDTLGQMAEYEGLKGGEPEVGELGPRGVKKGATEAPPVAPLAPQTAIGGPDDDGGGGSSGAAPALPLRTIPNKASGAGGLFDDIAPPDDMPQMTSLSGAGKSSRPPRLPENDDDDDDTGPGGPSNVVEKSNIAPAAQEPFRTNPAKLAAEHAADVSSIEADATARAAQSANPVQDAVDAVRGEEPPVPAPVRASKLPRQPAPDDLVQFLARQGGLSADQAAAGTGDLQAMDAHRTFVPGVGMLVRRTGGKSLDYAREAANEAGYGPFDTPADLLDAIGENIRGNRQFTPDDALQSAQNATAKAAGMAPLVEEADQRGNMLVARARQLGLARQPDWSLDDLDAAVTEREAMMAGPGDLGDLADAREDEAREELDRMRGLYDPLDRWAEENDVPRAAAVSAEPNLPGPTPANGQGSEADAAGRAQEARGPNPQAAGRGENAVPEPAEDLISTEDGVIPQKVFAGAERANQRTMLDRQTQGRKGASANQKTTAGFGLFDPDAAMKAPEEQPDIFAQPSDGGLAVDQAAAHVNTEPSDAQIEAGNYKKAHADIQGIPVSIETPKGAERSGVGPNGEPWTNVNDVAHYGYIKRTVGADNEHFDTYVGPNPESQKAFVVDQVDPKTGAFDEHKGVLGVDNLEQAKAVYDAGFSDGSGPKRRAAITEMSVPDFKDYLKTGDLKNPLGDIGKPTEAPARAPRQKLTIEQKLVQKKPLKETEHRDLLTKYFAPGRVVEGYGGKDVVTRAPEFENDGSWSVGVRGIDRSGNLESRERIHSTAPGRKNLLDFVRSDEFKNPKTDEESPAERPDEPAFQSTGTRKNLASVKVTGERLENPTPEEAKIADAVSGVLKKLTPSAEVRAARNIRADGDPVFGVTKSEGGKRVIAWSLEAPDAVGAARHEAVHYLRREGLISPAEWKTLADTAKSEDWGARHDIENRYGDLGKDGQTEEAVAEEFSKWRQDRRSQTGVVGKVFNRVDLALRRIGAAMRKMFGQNATADDVFSRIESGEVGRRAPAEGGNGAEPPKFAKAPPGGGGGGGKLPLPSVAKPLGGEMTKWEDDINRIRMNNEADRIQAKKFLAGLPKEMRDPALQERFYLHKEEGTPLSPDEQKLFDQHVAPIMKEAKDTYDRVRQNGYPVSDDGYVHRIVKGKGTMYDEPQGGLVNNPIYGKSLSKTAPSLKNRTMFMAEGDKGTNRLVTGDQYQPGDKFSDNGENFNVRQATTREIEANTNLEYYKNGLVNSLDNLVRLKRAERNIWFLDRLKTDPTFLENAKPVGAKDIPPGWRSTDLPQLAGWRMNPRLSNLFDDFQGGAKTDLGEVLGKVNHALVSTIFVNPISALFGHGLNVATHWFTGRGWDNFLPHTWGKSAANGMRAIKDVATLSPNYLKMMREGSALQYGPTLSRDFHEKMIEAMQGDIKKNPKTWGEIAKAAGTVPGAIYSALSDMSSRGLWFANDVLMLQRVYDLQGKGLTTRAAITDAERDIPNYRIPTEAWEGAGGRAFTELMKNPNLTLFGKYRYGMLKAYAGMLKDLKGGDAKARGAAVGKLVALAALVGGIYPMADAALQKATGNKDASFRRSGPAGPITDIYKAMSTGEKSFTDALSSVISPAPTLKSAYELSQNRESFTGQRVYNPQGSIGEIAKELGYYGAEQLSPAEEGMQVLRGTKTPVQTVAGWTGAKLPPPGQVQRERGYDLKEGRRETKAFEKTEARLKRGAQSLVP